MTEWHRKMIAFTVILLAVVEVLDMTIVTVALENMKGALQASPDQITWTITVYIVTAAVVMPLSGFLSKRFGRKTLLQVSSLGFGLSSLLCGFASSLLQIVIFRGIQGVCGALLPSLAQASLFETYPGKESNKAMAAYGVGLMLGPILGPVLGGYITDQFGWRWIFFINVPICIIASTLAWKFIPETPKSPQKIDWLGLFLLALGVGSLQYVLDKGNELGWLDSRHIQLFILVSVLGLLAFLYTCRNKPGAIVDLKVFKDKNYALSCLVMAFYFAVVMGTFSWLPLWMEIFMNYSPTLAGKLLIPRGIACLLVMMMTPFILKHLEARIAVAIACFIYSLSSYLLTGFNLEQGPEAIFWPNVLQGVASGFFFVPLTSLAYQSLPKSLMDTATGMFNFFRSLGSSIGVAYFSTIMSQQAQTAWHDMSAHIYAHNPALLHWLGAQGYQLNSQEAYARLANLINAQSYMIAFIDANHFFGILVFCIIPIVFFIDPKKGSGSLSAMH